MIRCKVSCWSVVETKTTPAVGSDLPAEKYNEVVTFGAVYSADPTSENAQWAKATPCLSMTQTIDNPAAWGKFVAGKEYFLDFTPV